VTPAVIGSSVDGMGSNPDQLLECPSWRELRDDALHLAGESLAGLLVRPQRYELFSRSAAHLHLDYSRQRVNEKTLEHLVQLAEERKLAEWRRELLSGGIVNNTERRPALHTALRSRSLTPLVIGGADIRPFVRNERLKMLELAKRVSDGNYFGYGGAAVTDVVNIGIGGSDLGLVMAVQALAAYRSGSIRVHFVSNIDGTELADLLPRLDPGRTLFVVCSKSFTTLETKLNADVARQWVLQSLPEAALKRQFVAVSVNEAAMDNFGIASENRFRIWDWVGGRYSLWSSVGLCIAIAIGSDQFEALLGGAADMDEHFENAPLHENLPVLLGLLGVWNQNLLGVRSHAVLPYSQRLSRFPAFLQQLEMESNGKCVTRTGKLVGWETGAVTWGEAGSNGQHAFFQLLHQGTAIFSVDFLAPVEPAGGAAGQHMAALANMLAQAEVLARGRSDADAFEEMISDGMREDAARTLAPHKVHPGNHPSSIILMDRLDPQSLGALVALYEHKVFVQSVIWGINPFDQWGVELGKLMAGEISDAFSSGGASILPPVADRILASAIR